MARERVVLPQPDSPTSPRISPWQRVKLTSRITRRGERRPRRPPLGP